MNLFKKTDNPKQQELKLKGNAVVFIDWANVYGWRDTLKYKPDPKIIFKYLYSYKNIKDVRFYYGKDSSGQSEDFLKAVQEIGFTLITKPVKHIVVGSLENTIIRKRKADFDLEIGLDCFENLDKYRTFIFFSGDGDFATLYKRLINHKKQVIVIFEQGHLGKEVWDITEGLFKTQLGYLDINNPPRDSGGA
jgi:uncharacterized LabA/DUF88 family protein